MVMILIVAVGEPNVAHYIFYMDTGIAILPPYVPTFYKNHKNNMNPYSTSE